LEVITPKFQVGGRGNNFRLPSTSWACSPLSGTAPLILCLSGYSSLTLWILLEFTRMVFIFNGFK